MPDTITLGGTFTLPGTSLTLHRMGYGAMQLAGPHVWGPPRDHASALAVLREAVALGVDHIDTADFYGPYVTNRLIHEALAPYPANLTLVTKVGFLRGEDQSWYSAHDRKSLAEAVHSNLKHLALDVLDVVNLRVGRGNARSEDSLAEPLEALAALQQQGLIRHLGVSNVSSTQLAEARRIAPIVCVQNEYNLARREDDAMLDALAADGIAFVPFFPLGGFSPLQSTTLEEVARALDATPLQTALAWLLHRSPNTLLIPGTSSVAHLRDNLKAAELTLPPWALNKLNTI